MPIPEAPPWRPSILQTGYPPPDRGELWDAGLAMGKNLGVQQYHYWRCLHACSAECGGTDEKTSEETIGWSEQVVREISDTLKLSFKKIGIELGEKTSESLTRVDERKETIKTTVDAPKCGVVKTAKWQLVERYVLLRQRRPFPFFKRVAEEVDRVDRRLGVTSQEPPILIDPVEHCCHRHPGGPDESLNEPFLITFSSGSIVLPGRAVSGLVILRGVRGQFKLGARILRSELAPQHAQFLTSVGALADEAGVLQRYRGSVANLLGRAKSAPPGATFPAWVVAATIGLGVGAVLVFFVRAARGQRDEGEDGSEGGSHAVSATEGDYLGSAARDITYESPQQQRESGRAGSTDW
jgi:hypothetical protein